MPTYEYACKACDHRFEITQSFHDDALSTCPACQGSLRKVFSAAGIIFKGSGWHVKDYAGSSATQPATESSSESATESTTTKPAAETTPKAPDTTTSSAPTTPASTST